MHSYFVRSGPLQITIVAASPYDAAIEAVRFWDDGAEQPAAEAAHRSNLDAVIEVRRTRAQRPPRLFPTFSLLCRISGVSRSQAWERVLREHVGQAN